MGTKLQGNAFLLNYHSVIDLDSSSSGGTMTSLYHETLKNDERYEREKVRRTILEHESIFRNQLQELHRIYGRQRELMNEIRSRETSKDGAKEEKCWLFSTNLLEDSRKPRDPYHSSPSHQMAGGLGARFSNVPVFERNHWGSYDTDNRFSLFNGVPISQHRADALSFDFKRKEISGEISTNLCSNVDLSTKNFFPSSVDRNERLFNDYAEKRRFDKFSSGKPLAFPQSLLAEPKKEIPNSPLDMGASVSRKRKKIFGVEICEENDDPINANTLNQKDENPPVLSSSWIDNSFMQSLHLRGANPNERSKVDVKCDLTSSKEIFSKNVDNMNLPIQVPKKDSQQSSLGLPWFLRNSQVCDDKSEEKKSSSCYFMNLDSLQNCSKKFFGKEEKPDEPFQTSNHNNTNEVKDGTSGKKIPTLNVFDLNLSLDEEINLEASIEVIESPLRDSSKNLELEICDEIAADAIMSMSALSQETGPVDGLKRFAEIVCGESSTIPDGIDYFEYMTLKLEDTKKEGYHYEPLVLTGQSDDETGVIQTKRSRRRGGGRHRKDFQRDILPGLVTLSRLQVTEDFQAFDELMKSGGVEHRRNGRGRRRAGGAFSSTTVKRLCSTEAEHPICQERGTLAGWGKRTRRLPRQRCPTNAFLSFPVKC